jgi:hypothetical protein
MSTSKLLKILACLALLAPTGACKDKKDQSNPPAESGEDASDDAADADSGEPEVSYPEQDADPPELAQAMADYLIGHYDKVVGACQPLSESLTEDSQIRARGISAALFAMAAGQDLAENAEAPATLALEQAGRLADDELTQLATLAMASFHLGVAEYATAQNEIEKVKDLSSPHSDLAMLMWSESVLGQAFEDDKLKYPDKLDEARSGYETVFARASDDAIKARAADGVTAVGFYKKDKDLTCEWAEKASGLYESVGATDYMKEGPKGSAEALRCG